MIISNCSSSHLHLFYFAHRCLTIAWRHTVLLWPYASHNGLAFGLRTYSLGLGLNGPGLGLKILTLTTSLPPGECNTCSDSCHYHYLKVLVIFQIWVYDMSQLLCVWAISWSVVIFQFISTSAIWSVMFWSCTFYPIISYWWWSRLCFTVYQQAASVHTVICLFFQIMNEITQHKINIYEFPNCADEEENKMMRKLKVCWLS